MANPFAKIYALIRQQDKLEQLLHENQVLKEQSREKLKSMQELHRSSRSENERQIFSREDILEADILVQEQLVWMFGSKRTGSTWLADMMNDVAENHLMWREPLLGIIWGYSYFDYFNEARREVLHKNFHFLMGSREESWMRAIRYSVLEGAAARFPNAKNGLVVIKEPNGSIGAPVLAKSTPRSKMILLVRDPRDILASVLDAGRAGGWSARRKEVSPAGVNAESQAKYIAKLLTRSIEAYDSHPGPKTAVRYEELVSDAEATLIRMYDELGIEVDSTSVRESAEKHSWRNIPDEEKGTGKFKRKGQAGTWKDDLTEDEVLLAARYAGHIMNRFGYDPAL